jgi:protein-L-isoaspartate(D-aspartate) O-methyltransferase
MAELGLDQRREWLVSLAERFVQGGARRDAILAQELREVARGCRLSLVDAVAKQLGPFDPRHLSALLEVPRERFVRPGDIEQSVDDLPLPLDGEGLATISAPHAYLLSYRLLGLGLGDHLVELGTGSGYGAALAAFIVGPEGRVLSFEIDLDLASWARRTLCDEPNVEIVEADAVDSALLWRNAPKVAVTFAVETLPEPWLDALPEAGTLVAPVGPLERDQRLVLFTKRRGRIVQTDHGAVRYVKNRSTR